MLKCWFSKKIKKIGKQQQQQTDALIYFLVQRLELQKFFSLKFRLRRAL